MQVYLKKLLVGAKNVGAATAVCVLTLTGSNTAQAQAISSDDPAVQTVLQRLPDRGRIGMLGVLRIDVFPQAQLDGKQILMAPGARVFSTGNALIIPSTVQGKDLAVSYRLDFLNQVIEAWVVTDDEIKAIRQLARSRTGQPSQ